MIEIQTIIAIMIITLLLIAAAFVGYQREATALDVPQSNQSGFGYTKGLRG